MAVCQSYIYVLYVLHQVWQLALEREKQMSEARVWWRSTKIESSSEYNVQNVRVYSGEA